jgi:Rps23 Pro-64 3,4-dihydroxylase Tpa1-like proline 4-hydroxylase
MSCKENFANMCISKKPDFKSINNNVIVFNNVLSDVLLKECVDYTNYCIKEDIYSTTNKESWDNGIVENSEEIKIIKLFEMNIKLQEKICYELSNKYEMLTEGLKINIHIMREGCYINDHTDNHVVYAFTIYLNDDWNIENGGIFQYDIENTVYGVFPRYNTMVMIQDNIHRVTKIRKDVTRITIQGFYSESYFYKKKPINVLLHNNFIETKI